MTINKNTIICGCFICDLKSEESRINLQQEILDFMTDQMPLDYKGEQYIDYDIINDLIQRVEKYIKHNPFHKMVEELFNFLGWLKEQIDNSLKDKAA